jgi:class 3 adenylate cyclase
MLIARFDGFIARYVGDGVLIYFGYPQAPCEVGPLLLAFRKRIPCDVANVIAADASEQD